MKTIEIITLDKYNNQTDSHEFDTMKEARQWVNECGLSKDFWNRKGETNDFAACYVHTLQLHKNGECIQDWFPIFN